MSKKSDGGLFWIGGKGYGLRHDQMLYVTRQVKSWRMTYFVSFTLDVYTVPGAYFVHPYRDAKLDKLEICGGYKNPQKNLFYVCS